MPPSFIDHVALLGACLDRRAVIVEAIERQILNVQDKETSRSRDRGRLERLLSGLFHAEIGIPHLSGATAFRLKPEATQFMWSGRQ